MPSTCLASTTKRSCRGTDGARCGLARGERSTRCIAKYAEQRRLCHFLASSVYLHDGNEAMRHGQDQAIAVTVSKGAAKTNAAATEHAASPVDCKLAGVQPKTKCFRDHTAPGNC